MKKEEREMERGATGLISWSTLLHFCSQNVTDIYFLTSAKSVTALQAAAY